MRANEFGNIKEIPWDSNPIIGWWENNNPLRMYHGTDKMHLESFAKHGLNRPDPRTGMYSLAFEPFTARAFAVMGGEARFLAAQSKALVVPEDRRVVVVFDLPKDWVEQYKDSDFHGNDYEHKLRLKYHEVYEQFHSSDQQYYQLCELRVSNAIPTKFIVGYMQKN